MQVIPKCSYSLWTSVSAIHSLLTVDMIADVTWRAACKPRGVTVYKVGPCLPGDKRIFSWWCASPWIGKWRGADPGVSIFSSIILILPKPFSSLDSRRRRSNGGTLMGKGGCPLPICSQRQLSQPASRWGQPLLIILYNVRECCSLRTCILKDNRSVHLGG